MIWGRRAAPSLGLSDYSTFPLGRRLANNGAVVDRNGQRRGYLARYGRRRQGCGSPAREPVRLSLDGKQVRAVEASGCERFTKVG